VLYPPLVTDFDRQVRLKTHGAHSSLFQKAGKRSLKYMKTCAGPWIASRYDPDRQVARFAEESFRNVFDTDQKQEIVWERYSTDVLEFITDTITKETSKTISKRQIIRVDSSRRRSLFVG
jgi:hypothetical protein